MPINSKFKPSRFRKGEDPVVWINRFNKAAILNVWSDEAKLFVVDSCLPPSVQNWFAQCNFATWSEFKKEFELRYRVRKSPEKLLKKILSFEMKRNESVYKYIDRFNTLHSEYETILKLDKERHAEAVAPVPRSTATSVNDSGAPTPHDTPPNAAPMEDTSLIDIHEANYVKYFIDGLRSRTIKRQLRSESHSTLKGVQNSMKKICEEDDDYVEDSDDDESDSDDNNDPYLDDSDSEEDVYYVPKSKKGKENRRSPKGNTVRPEVSPATRSEFAADAELKELVKNMSLMMGEFVKSNQNGGRTNQSTGSSNNFACYNCQETTHGVSECTNPCKLCKNPDHRHYQCSRYVSRKKPAQSPALIAQLLVSKRVHEDDGTTQNVPLVVDDPPNNKRAKTGRKNMIPATRARSNVQSHDKNNDGTQDRLINEIGTSAKPATKVSPMNLDDGIPHAQQSPQLSNIRYPKLTTTEDQSNKDELRSEQHKLVQDIMERPMLQLSLNQLVSLSPSSRTQFKAAFTKPQKKPHVKKNAHLLMEDDSFGNKLKEDVKDSIPRIKGQINGVDCEMILDTGCTSFIISAHFAKQIGITEITPVKQELLLGDGSVASCLGIIRGLTILVGDTVAAEVDATCLDVNDKFDFIIGHTGLQLLGMGVDHGSQFWYFRLPHGEVIPASVYFENRRNQYRIKEDSDVSEDEQYEEDEVGSFLMVIASDDEDEVLERAPRELENTSSRLGSLPDQIKDNPLLSSDQSNRLINLVNDYSDCFGVDYSHLGSTNLVEFKVDTGDHAPIYNRPYSFLSHAEKEYMKENLRKMVESGILIPTMHDSSNSRDSGWAFPCRYITKKTGDRRLVTNFTQLNAITVRDPWPLPLLTDILEAFSGANFFLPN